MSDARATCPHCHTEQPVADWRQRACTQCGRMFYPAPAVDPALQRRQRARRVLRARDEQAAQDPIGRFQACSLFGGFLLLVLIAQIGFDAVFFAGRNSTVVILRHEEPERYWNWVATTAAGAVVFLSIGIYGQRRIRARIAQRFPEDET